LWNDRIVTANTLSEDAPPPPVDVLIRWSQTSGIAPWTFLAYPDGSPYFRLRVPAPFEALLIPEPEFWFLVRVREAKIRPSLERLVSTTGSAEAVISAAVGALKQFAIDERNSREFDAADAYAQAATWLANALGAGTERCAPPS
jgi:hypothetical protein